MPRLGCLQIDLQPFSISSASFNVEMPEPRFRFASNQPPSAAGILGRKPQRITITISWSVYQKLIQVSNAQGRSLSNTAAYWLERQSEEIDRQAA